MLVGEREEDAFDDADADDTAVAAVDDTAVAAPNDTAVAAADDMVVAAVVLVGKLADGDKALAEEVEREEVTRCVQEFDKLSRKH